MDRGESAFAVLPGIVSSSEVQAILELVNSTTAAKFDDDPDSVDGMASHEIFIDNDELRSGELTPTLKGDGTREGLKSRQSMREGLKEIMDPILRDRLTPFIRQHFPDLCDSAPGRECMPCYSLVRRYRSGERRSHEPHRDSHARVTIVVSLSEFMEDYRGGIYVAAARSEKLVAGLARGDAIVHESSLLHGVQVENDGGERWSWILWYRDSQTCENFSGEWFREISESGDAVGQAMFADGGAGGAGQEEVVRLHQEAAKKGLASSSVKLARAYLKQLPSSLPLDVSEASRLYRQAIQTSREPDAMYGLAQMLLQGTASPQGSTGDMRDVLKEVAYLLEAAAEEGQHKFAMFNLGVMHLYGYTRAWGGERDPKLAAEWFEKSEIPEGLFVASMYYASVGDGVTEGRLKDRAVGMGYGSAWRKAARQQTGSGGASGVDLNMAWPELPGTGVKPEEW